MKKKLLSLLLAAIMITGAFTVTAQAAFVDIADSETAIAAAALESMGIVNGTGTSTYSPNKTLNRAEFATLAVRAMGLEDRVSSYTNKALFSDVQPGKWFTGYVNLAYSEGIVNGYGNGKFGPDDEVTYGQVVTILLRMLGYTEAEIGKAWPADYVAFASELGLQGSLNLTQNTNVNRGQAAILLYNTVRETKNGDTRAYFETISGVASTERAIILSNDATSGGSSGYLMVCAVGDMSADIKYYKQKNPVSDTLTGNIGKLLLDSSGRSIGFVPDGDGYKDVMVASATASGITTRTGDTVRITGSATVISGGSVYTYNSTGYMQVDAQSGKNARLYYDENGAVSHVYLTSGASSSTTDAAVATTENASAELYRALGISSGKYSVVKNGAAAEKTDLAQYDAAYYDAAANTLYASDYKISGYISAATPSVGAAQTISIAGATLDVLECAWDTLGDFKLGDSVTLLLTDDNKVAAAYPVSKVTAAMIGVLSEDGGTVTLCGSGITFSGVTSGLNAGGLVRVAAYSGSVTCTALSETGTSYSLNLTTQTLGSYSFAPSVEIYENAAQGTAVYSLEGEKGAASYDTSAVYWTNMLTSSKIAYYHLNTLGQIDILLLRDVTGGCYDFGEIKLYTGKSGINLGAAGMDAYNNAFTLTNSANMQGSAKHLSGLVSIEDGYAGIATYNYSNSYKALKAHSKLTSAPGQTNGFFKSDDAWYTSVGGYELPVSEYVQVYVKSTSLWLSGESGLLTAISSDMSLTVYYSGSLLSNAQVRIIVIS